MADRSDDSGEPDPNLWHIYAKGRGDLPYIQGDAQMAAWLRQVREKTERLAEEISSHVIRKGRLSDAFIVEVYKASGTVLVSCDADYGRTLGKLPSAEGSNYALQPPGLKGRVV